MQSVENTPFNNVPRVVWAVGRITTNGISLLGTCFLVSEGKFATTQHVTGGDDSNLVIIFPKQDSLLEYQDTSDPEVSSIPAKITEIDPFRDLCILSIEAETSPNYQLGKADDVPPGSSVVVFGFPHADHGRLVLTQQNARVGARVLIESGGIKNKHLILNTQARPGQSGGPVFNPASMTVAGILIGSYAPGGGGGISLGGVDPHTLHQTTHIISAEYLGDMI